MARTPNPKDAPVDFEDLIGGTSDEDKTTPAEPVSENAPVELTPAQRRLAEARAKKAELEAAAEAKLTADEEEFEGLTEEEIAELKALEDENAATATAIIENAPERFGHEVGKVILVHVVEDGFTEFGKVWLRGQELRIDEKAYKRTQDRFGVSWVDTHLNDPHKQFAEWKHVYVAPGPFVPRPGEVFEDSVAREDARRQGRIPASVN